MGRKKITPIDKAKKAEQEKALKERMEKRYMNFINLNITESRALTDDEKAEADRLAKKDRDRMFYRNPFFPMPKEKEANREEDENMARQWTEEQKRIQAEKIKAARAKKKAEQEAAELDVLDAVSEDPVCEVHEEDQLESLAKLRELAEAKQVETTETENTTTEIESVTTEEPTEIVAEQPKIVGEVTKIVSEVVVAEIAPAMAEDITLALTTSEAESLYEFIRDELLTVVKRDDIEELDWLADMCSIYQSLKFRLIRG